MHPPNGWLLFNRLKTVTTPIDFQVTAQGVFLELNRIYFEMELELTDENGGNLTKTAGDAVSMMSPVNNFKTFLCSHLHRSRNKRESSSSSSIPPCPSSFFFCRLKATLVTSYVDIFFTDLTFGHSSSIFGE